MILANGGRFKGCHLVLGKKGTGANVAIWYYEKNYSAIINYIKNETQCFLEFVSHTQKLLSSIYGAKNE